MGKTEIRKEVKPYGDWHPGVTYIQGDEYHIVHEGILNRQDYSLLFENEESGYHIPVEVTDHINIYADVTVSPGTLKLLGRKGISLSYFDNYGNCIGTFLPESAGTNATLFLKQCSEYLDDNIRAETASLMETSYLFNMLATLNYYSKKNNLFSKQVEELNSIMNTLKDEKTLENMMLSEARAREIYYSCFDDIFTQEDMKFVRRSKRPPLNEVNALISFGNTLLYNKLLQIIWRGSLDPRIGIVHATNRRQYTLNLDFADIFKPVIVDRLIFSLINHRVIRKEHFEKVDNGGIYLSNEGKKIFIDAFQKKLNDKRKVNGESMSYLDLMKNEVRKYEMHIRTGCRYKPYKFY